MDPVLDEILRCRLPIRPDVLRRWQTHIREVLGPQVRELEELKADPPKPDPKKGRAA